MAKKDENVSGSRVLVPAVLLACFPPTSRKLNGRGAAIVGPEQFLLFAHHLLPPLNPCEKKR